jgi:hypothetical protein
MAEEGAVGLLMIVELVVIVMDRANWFGHSVNPDDGYTPPNKVAHGSTDHSPPSY